MVHILISDPNHPTYPKIKAWADKNGAEIFHRKADLLGGDRLYLLSCTEKVTEGYNHIFVIHESPLPKGRGWSPLAWQILKGKHNIVVSLINAADKIDCGDIYARRLLKLNGTELYDEIADKLADIKIAFLEDEIGEPCKQTGEPTYYRKRTPEDSELDIRKTIDEQFNLLRICEPRFPAFFVREGVKYKVTIERF